MGESFILSAGADFAKQVTFAGVVLASPLQGRRERGFVCYLSFSKQASKMLPCPSKTSSQVNESPTKNFNAQKNSAAR